MADYFGYRFVLLAIFILVAVHLAFVLYMGRATGLFGEAAVHTAVPALIAFGLWLQSKFVRYLGAAWLLIFAAGATWPLLSGRPVWGVGLLWLVPTGVLSLAIGLALLFSRRFATEFLEERDRQPRYKGTLRKIMVIALIVAAVVATLNDLHHLLAM